jgi:AcrR family transcriptional regulator
VSSTAPTGAATETRARRHRADGERSRRAILEGATQLATVEGLEGLSIGRLAEHIGMSKSGLYSHFGSKQELQLAAIETAAEIFDREVTRPGLDHPEGVAQILGLTEAFLSHLERGVFPGGCFFAAAGAELAAREGVVKDTIGEFLASFVELFANLIRDAQRLGEIDPGADPDQLAFEIDSFLLGANGAFVLFSDEQALERARRAMRERLDSVSAGA